jgi:hypothetical protein
VNSRRRTFTLTCTSNKSGFALALSSSPFLLLLRIGLKIGLDLPVSLSSSVLLVPVCPDGYELNGVFGKKGKMNRNARLLRAFSSSTGSESASACRLAWGV